MEKKFLNDNLEDHKLKIETWDKYIDDDKPEKGISYEELSRRSKLHRACSHSLGLLIDAVVHPSALSLTKSQLLDVFTDKWFDQNRSKDHPLIMMLSKTMPTALECVASTFAFISVQLGSQWLDSKYDYVQRLRKPSEFHNTLFELEIFALLQRDGFDLDLEFQTHGNMNVEARIAKDGDAFLIECKCMGESEYYKEMSKRLGDLSFAQSNCYFKIEFKEYPTVDHIDELGKALKVASPPFSISTEIYDATLSNEPISDGDQPNMGMGVISFGQVDDKRVRTVLNNTYKKFIKQHDPTVLIAKVSIAAGINNAYKQVKEIVRNSNKYKSISQILFVDKSKAFTLSCLCVPEIAPQHKGTRPGYNYNMYLLKNSTDDANKTLHYSSGFTVSGSGLPDEEPPVYDSSMVRLG